MNTKVIVFWVLCNYSGYKNCHDMNQHKITVVKESPNIERHSTSRRLYLNSIFVSTKVILSQFTCLNKILKAISPSFLKPLNRFRLQRNYRRCEGLSFDEFIRRDFVGFVISQPRFSSIEMNRHLKIRIVPSW